MKLRELINEVNIFQNNFVKIEMVQDELKKVFGDEAPKIKFDEDGLYITMDNFLFREYENNPLDSFTLTDAGMIDEVKNIKKYYVEYVKVEKTETPTETESETPTE